MATESTGGKQERRGKGRFPRGVSGNPAGRPKGSRNKTTALCQQLLDDDAEALIASLVKRAKRGDGVALRLVVERLLPRVRARTDVAIELPELGRAGDIVVAWGAVIGAAASGTLSLEEAGKFGAILEGQRKALETADLAVRIDTLEQLSRRQS